MSPFCPPLPSVATGVADAAGAAGAAGTAEGFLLDLAVVLCVAAVTTVVFQKLRQPVVLGYLIAGLIVGPHVPPVVIQDIEHLEVLSELGVILLMFSLGLEFSVRRIFQIGPTAGIVCAVEVGGMLWLGFSAAQLLGWSTLESVYAGAALSISSTMIVTKCFQERAVAQRTRDLALGVLVSEDLAAILLLAALTALGAGDGDLSLAEIGVEALRLAAFLAALLAVGMLVVPRVMRALASLRRRETTLVASVGMCFALALVARGAGYSVVLGAFLAGSLIAESGYARLVEGLVEPLRDMFAAVFFVSVGMLIDPALIAEHLGAVLVCALVVIAGKALFVSLGGFLAGQGTRTSVRAGLALGQIGEFSFIIAGLGRSLGAAGERMAAVAVAVSTLTAFSTPLLMRFSDRVAAWVDRRLPRRLQTFASLYATWIEEVKGARTGGGFWRLARPMLRIVLVDALVLIGIVAASSIARGDLASILVDRLGLSALPASLAVSFLTAMASLPFVLGIVRAVRKLGSQLAFDVMPAAEEGLDRAAAPRRMLTASLQMILLLMVGLPLVAVMQPFLPGLPLGPLFAFALVPLALLFWRRASDLQGHVRAGAQIVVEALVRDAREREAHALETAHELLPGLGELTSVRLESGSPAVGRTLGELDLRGRSRATVIAITRGGERIALPDGGEQLEPGDVLALNGSQPAIERASGILLGRDPG